MRGKVDPGAELLESQYFGVREWLGLECVCVRFREAQRSEAGMWQGGILPAQDWSCWQLSVNNILDEIFLEYCSKFPSYFSVEQC